MWLLFMLDRFTPVNAPSANSSGVVRWCVSIGRSIACSLSPTNACAAFLRACLPRKSGGAASNKWHASLDGIATPSPKGVESYGKNVACRPVVYAAPALDANIWKKYARGTDGLAGTFAGCHGRRSDNRHEMDSSLAAKTLQGLASSGCAVVSHNTCSIVAPSALLAANLSQAKSRHPQPGSRSAISLPAPVAKLVFDSKLAGN